MIELASLPTDLQAWAKTDIRPAKVPWQATENPIRYFGNIPLDEPFRQRFKNPYGVIHRGDLHGVLLKACRSNPLVELRTSKDVIGYEQHGETVHAGLKDGNKVEGAALIGAHGANGLPTCYAL